MAGLRHSEAGLRRASESRLWYVLSGMGGPPEYGGRPPMGPPSGLRIAFMVRFAKDGGLPEYGGRPPSGPWIRASCAHMQCWKIKKLFLLVLRLARSDAMDRISIRARTQPYWWPFLFSSTAWYALPRMAGLRNSEAGLRGPLDRGRRAPGQSFRPQLAPRLSDRIALSSLPPCPQLGSCFLEAPHATTHLSCMHGC